MSNDAAEETMTECIECGDGGEGTELLNHHISYERDETVPVCLPCHQRIHGSKRHRLYPEDRPDTTTISMTNELADELYRMKGRGESYEDVLWRLLQSDSTGGRDAAIEDGYSD